MGYWNWFQPGDQQRGSGEASRIAGSPRRCALAYAIDARRICVAGFSAGGAMAAVMAAAYPDVYAAVGVHSGLPAAPPMTSRPLTPPWPRGADAADPTGAADRVPRRRDPTVAVGNGEAVVRAALLAKGRTEHARESGRTDGGRGWTRERWAEPGGRVLVESWTVHGMGHDWSGGRAGASYADPAGPDVAAAMLAFFGFTTGTGVQDGRGVG